METTTCTHPNQVSIIDPFSHTARWICEHCGADAGAHPAEFNVGDVCTARSACDHDTVFTWTIVKRTAKFITVRDDFGKESRVGVKTDEQGEWAMPQGTFSMAPVIRATH